MEANIFYDWYAVGYVITYYPSNTRLIIVIDMNAIMTFSAPKVHNKQGLRNENV
jgi:hypothetical protein